MKSTRVLAVALVTQILILTNGVASRAVPPVFGSMLRRVFVNFVLDDVLDRPRWAQNVNRAWDFADVLIIQHMKEYWGDRGTEGVASSRTFAENWRHINECRDACLPVFKRLTEGTELENRSCADLVFDIDAGTMAGVAADASPDAIVGRLPCFDDVEVGKAISYKTLGFHYHIQTDGLTVYSHFVGRTSEEILGLDRLEVIRRFGVPFRERVRTMSFRSAYGYVHVGLDEEGIVRNVTVRDDY